MAGTTSDELRPYVVRQGDYLLKLAYVHGFDAEDVWNAPQNQALRELREDHHILAPGDVLYIPVKKKEGLPITKGTTNKYVAKKAKTRASKATTSLVQQIQGNAFYASFARDEEGIRGPLAAIAAAGDAGNIPKPPNNDFVRRALADAGFDMETIDEVVDHSTAPLVPGLLPAPG